MTASTAIGISNAARMSVTQCETVSESISKANASCTVTGYDVPFDNLPHSATGKCIGVDGATIIGNGGLDLSGTVHTAQGTYPGDAWSFDATNAFPNYNEIVDEFVTDTITAASPGGGGCTTGCVF